MEKQQNTQQPVAWCELTQSGKIGYFDGKPMIMVSDVGNDCHQTPLFTYPPVPRDVLMAALGEINTNLMNVSGACFSDEYIAAIAERYASQVQPVAVPDGYALVPVEPTPKMLEAMVEAAECDFPYCEAISSYYAMLSAAQKEKGNNY